MEDDRYAQCEQGHVWRLAPTKLTVFVVELGVYAERLVVGVHPTIEQAKDGHKTAEGGWQEHDGPWWSNGLDMGEAVTITSYEVSL
jgi:hypothetical protein